MHISITIGELLDRGLWPEWCAAHDTPAWPVGQADRDTIMQLTAQEAMELGLFSRTDTEQPPMDEHVTYEVSLWVTVGWSSADCDTAAEWAELQARTKEYSSEDFAEILIETYEKTSDLLQAARISFRNL